MIMRRAITHVAIIACVNFITGPQPSSGECVKPPLTCPDPRIGYYLTTSQGVYYSPIAANDTDSIINATFIPDAEIKLLIHGYTENRNETPNKELIPEYSRRLGVDVNIISLDYGELATLGCAQEAVSLICDISRCVAQFMNSLFTIRTDIRLRDLQVIAFSLGCGISFELHKYLTIGQVPRMTQLEPIASLDLGNTLPPFYKDSKNVSVFLEVYHTFGGILTGGLPYGDTDVFFNGGSYQTLCGCKAVSFNRFQTLCNRKGATINDAFCSHTAVASYYAASINASNEFWAHGVLHEYSEPEFYLVGEYANTSARGLFYVDTSKEYPYALGENDALLQTMVYNVTKPKCHFASCYDHWLLTNDTHCAHYPTKKCIVPKKKCPNDKISYYLYNKNTNAQPVKLDTNQPESFKDAPFLTNASVKILLHDYAISHVNESSPNEIITAEYMKSSTPVNVTSVEYLELVALGCLTKAIRNVDLVSACVAQFINTLLDCRTDIAASDIHLVAFGLSVPMALQMNNITRGPLGRITALDGLNYVLYEGIIPPLYKDGGGKANFVDVLHTDIGNYGDITTFGDVNFYSSGGLFQSPCNCRGTTLQDKICSHKKAQIYFAESINSAVGFWGHAGPRDVRSNPVWSLFGEHTNYNANGVYLFDVNKESPYAQGKVYNESNGNASTEAFPCGWLNLADEALESLA